MSFECFTTPRLILHIIRAFVFYFCSSESRGGLDRLLTYEFQLLLNSPQLIFTFVNVKVIGDVDGIGLELQYLVTLVTANVKLSLDQLL